MTYLELLNKIKNGTQPEMVLFKDDMYVWCGTDYKLSCGHIGYICNRLRETEMVTKNCIFEVHIIKDK